MNLFVVKKKGTQMSFKGFCPSDKLLKQ